MQTRRALVAAALLLSVAGCGSNSPTVPSGITVYDANTPGVSLPTVVTQVNPSYTPQALANRITGTVRMAAVVSADGTVGDVTVVQSLDTVYGLDAQAVLAAKQWIFNPGMKDGKAVAVRVTIEMTFSLH